jgi:hypothetical protein
MGSIPAQFSLDRLVGKTLTQVALGPYDLQFGFGGRDFIQCVGRLFVELSGASTLVYDHASWGDISPLKDIAGRTVQSWSVDTPRQFSLTLSGGARLRFQCGDVPGEEFIVHPEILVV